MSTRRTASPPRPGAGAPRSSPRVRVDVLELFVLASDPTSETASLLASFRNARVLAPFPRRGGEAGARWQRIIRAHERTLAVLEGRARGRTLPHGRELRAWGRDLFELLFPGDVHCEVRCAMAADAALQASLRVTGSKGELTADNPIAPHIGHRLRVRTGEHEESEQRRELLREEVRVAREIVSPNVCRVFDLVVEVTVDDVAVPTVQSSWGGVKARYR